MLKVIIPPEEILTADDCAEFMRAEFSANEESLIESLITAAREWTQEYLFRAVGVQTMELRQQGFPAGNAPIVLPSPIISVTSIKYLDSSRSEVTMSADDYIVSDAEPAMIVPVSSWPDAYVSPDSVRVLFQAGYSVGSPVISQELPKTIRTAMLMLVADMFENREAQTSKPLTANPTLERLLAPFRLEMGI